MLLTGRTQCIRSASNPFKRRRVNFRPHSSSSVAQAPTAFGTRPPTDPTPPLPSTAEVSPPNTVWASHLSSFRALGVPHVVLSPPLPIAERNARYDKFFPDSHTQDLLAVMDACLWNAHDVSRAHRIFQDFIRSPEGRSTLKPHLYDELLEGYLVMADTEKPGAKRDKWIEYSWDLYELMGGEDQLVPKPSAQSIATMFLLNHRHTENSGERTRLYSELMQHATELSVNLSDVLTRDIFEKAPDAVALTEVLINTANTSIPQPIRPQVLSELQHITPPNPLGDVPEVRPVAQPKSATGEMPFNLVTLREDLGKMAPTSTKTSYAALHRRQEELETSAMESAKQKFENEAESIARQQSVMSKRSIQAWMWEWYTKLLPVLADHIETLEAQEEEVHAKFQVNFEKALKKSQMTGTPVEQLLSKNQIDSLSITQYLKLLPVSKLAMITILEAMRLQGSGGIQSGMKTTRALVCIGRAVETEHRESKMRIREKQREKARKDGAVTEEAELDRGMSPEWSQIARATVGGFLMDRLVTTAKVSRTVKFEGKEITEEQDAFSHGYEYVKGKKLGVISLNPAVVRQLGSDEMRHTLHPRHLPMLVPPRKWRGVDDGAYLKTISEVMRYKESAEQQKYLMEACKSKALTLVYRALDFLGSTPWQVNRPIFDVVLQVWNGGGSFPRVPPVSIEEPEPVKPDNFETDKKARSQYIQNYRYWAQEKANIHADRCHVNYKLEIARSFLADTFYIPHNLDFRGRAYPMPPHLNHIGDDLSRGLLKFGVGKPLGEKGLRWLKIHLANVFGFDKGSFDERMQFTMDHLDDVFDSADNPLEGRRWWLKADDAWQCLATCMELRDALRSPDPHEFISYLPVHQDGTCNGLQHYAALGGDAVGARQVNLDVTNRPSDVYTFVAEMVEKKAEEDAANGNKAAQLVKGKISRKVVKQTVMTTVYGVTFIGAREQISKQLRDRGDIPKEELWSASSYLAHQTLHCIGDLFKGAKSIQNWLNLSARVIAKSIPAERVLATLSRPVPASVINKAIDKVAEEQELETKLAEQALLDSEAEAKLLKELEQFEAPEGQEGHGAAAEAFALSEGTSVPTVEHPSEAVSTTEDSPNTEATASQDAAADSETIQLNQTQLKKIMQRLAKERSKHRAERLRKEQMTAVVWTTHLGLPIVQPYRKDKKKQIQTSLQSVYIADPNAPSEVNSIKQASAFPPNFIHSLDATHMMLTALGCQDRAITFASVHDSYWTHACDIERMSSVIRQTFIELHSSDILDKLQEEFKVRYKDHKISLNAIKDHPELLNSNVDKLTPVQVATLKKGGTQRSIDEFDEVDEEDEAEALAAAESGGSIASKRKKVTTPAERMEARFVNLVDFMQELPKKGDFDVKKIKKSLYFFS